LRHPFLYIFGNMAKPYNKEYYINVIKSNPNTFLPMDKSFTLSPGGVRLNAHRPRHIMRKDMYIANSPKPETIAFLRQFARAFYPGTESRTLNVILN